MVRCAGLWKPVAGIGLCLMLFPVAGVDSASAPPLVLIRSVDLPGFSGDFDHFAADLKGERLFLAGEDHKTLEVFDIRNGKRLRSIGGFGAPHSVLYLPVLGELFVTDGEDGTVKIFRGADYTLIGKIQLLPGADSAGYDAATGTYYVVTGGKDVPLDYSMLSAVDLEARKKTGDLRFDSNHVEAMALEKEGPRMFINITDRAEVAVVDRNTLQVAARWPVGVAQQNSPIALDEPNHRLFVICRNPPILVVMNTVTGQVVTSLPTAARADDVAFDQATHRIYVPGGEGYIAVYQQTDRDHYQPIGKVASAPGAKTALLVPEVGELFVAVSPGNSKAMAKVLTYRLQP
jgi:hypothetical protein